jgi:hypothetical protein
MISCSSDKSDITIGLNENIHHDDFEYSVTDYSLTKQIGKGQDTITTEGTFYLIHFKVINEAKRVNHSWNNSIAYIIDGEGNIYENNINAQIKLNEVSPFGWNEKYITPFQSVDTSILVFNLPDNVKNPCLMVRGETLMGDFFNRNKFKKMKVRLFQ